MNNDTLNTRTRGTLLQRSTSFRYNKQLIAQLVGRHEDLSHPQNSCHPRASPSGDMNFQGGTNLRVSLQTGQ